MLALLLKTVYYSLFGLMVVCVLGLFAVTPRPSGWEFWDVPAALTPQESAGLSFEGRDWRMLAVQANYVATYSEPFPVVWSGYDCPDDVGMNVGIVHLAGLSEPRTATVNHLRSFAYDYNYYLAKKLIRAGLPCKRIHRID